MSSPMSSHSEQQDDHTMNGTPGPGIRRAATHNPDPRAAVAELVALLGDAADGGVIFFCAPTYDLEALAAALRAGFRGPVTGCTGAGQIGPEGYQRDGIVAIGMTAASATMRVYPVTPLADCQRAAQAAAAQAAEDLRIDGRRAFGLILADGLSLAEERLAATLYQSLGAVPLVGGSAGDDLQFEHTFVFVDGEFREGAAAFAVVATSEPFSIFKIQHFAPTRKRMVITAADPARRLVREINGRPAAQAYADLVGVPVADLNATVFSTNPVMLRLGDQYYVRSIQQVCEDGSLAFYCAIEAGLVLTIGEGVDVLEALEAGFAGVPADADAVLGCDCILRRLEFEQRGLRDSIGASLARRRVVGFSTFGEQYNGVHVNQTFVGVALGGSHV